MLAYPHTSALVAMPLPASALPLELRLLEAESALEAAQVIWVRRARDLDAKPSPDALRLAQWACEDLRDAQDDVDALRAEAAL